MNKAVDYQIGSHYRLPGRCYDCGRKVKWRVYYRTYSGPMLVQTKPMWVCRRCDREYYHLTYGSV